jgi:hypothetical protein
LATSTTLLDWLTLFATLVIIGAGVVALVAPATAATIVRVYRPFAIGVGVLWGVPLLRWILVGVITGKLRAAAMPDPERCVIAQGKARIWQAEAQDVAAVDRLAEFTCRRTESAPRMDLLGEE